jgi:hypothetical protein
MKLKLKYISVFFLLLMYSCGSYYYMPTQQQIPLFTEKNELHMTGGIDGQEFNNFQFSYSLTNSIGLQVNTLFKGGGKEGSNYGSLIEGGPGYHFNLNKHFIIETFAGYGNANLNKNNETFHLSFDRFYIYPIFGFQSKFVDIAYSIRYNYLTYHFKGIPPPYSKTQTAFWEPYNLNNNSYEFLESALTLRLGYKYIKLQGQYNWIVGHDKYNFNYMENNISISLFIMIPLDKLRTKKNKDK